MENAGRLGVCAHVGMINARVDSILLSNAGSLIETMERKAAPPQKPQRL